MTASIPDGMLLTKTIVRYFIFFFRSMLFLCFSLMLRFITIDTNAALHYYSHENVRTANGVLNITTEQKVNYYKAFDEKKKFWYVDKKHIQSGMVQTWNKFCFIGGIVEVRAKLPGDPHKGGLWPACTLSITKILSSWLFLRSLKYIYIYICPFCLYSVAAWQSRTSIIRGIVRLRLALQL